MAATIARPIATPLISAVRYLMDVDLGETEKRRRITIAMWWSSLSVAQSLSRSVAQSIASLDSFLGVAAAELCFTGWINTLRTCW